MTTSKTFTAITNSEMDARYFSAPRLWPYPNQLKPGIFKDYGELAPLTIRTTFQGLAFDFNCGMRLQIPAGNWHVKIFDHDSEVLCFDEDASDVLLISLEKFFVRWEFFLWLDGQLVFHHLYDPTDENVHFAFPTSGMGDRIVLFPYMEEFRKKWKCKVSCSVEPYLQELLRLYFPEIDLKPPKSSYAMYSPSPGLSPSFTPEEVRKAPMEKIGQQIFGLQRAEKIIYHPTNPRQIAEPYVCIAVQTSATFKTWLNPDGWPTVVDYLKQLGYRVLCIDKERERTDHGFTVKIPAGAEDFTGNLPLSERVNLLAYAEFFIGTSSGLSWLAWATDCPVILISGITPVWFEFSTPYRVINRLVCFGCVTDVSLRWGDFENCPHHQGTDRAYECSKKISARQVIQTINQLLDDKRTGRIKNSNFI